MQNNQLTPNNSGLTFRPLTVLETEIKAHSVNATSSIIAIGRALLEAKAQLSHGQWAAWLADKVQFSQSTAGNFMRIAREVNITPELANLPYTKVLPLLALPPEKREEIISDPKTDEMSAAELRKAVKAREEAEKRANSALQNYEDAAQKADDLAQQLKEAQKQLEQAKAQGNRASDMNEQYADAVAKLQRQLEEAQKQASAAHDAPPRVEYERVEVPPADYDGLKARIAEAEQYAEEAERRAQEAQQEAQRLRMQQSGNDAPEDDFIKLETACRDFVGAVSIYIYADSSEFSGIEHSELAKLKAWVDTVGNWATNMQRIIRGAEATAADGAVI